MVRSERDVTKLVRDHQKLAHYAVDRYLKRHFVGAMEREDLVSRGMMDLAHAGQARAPALASSFTTLACMSIDRMITQGMMREWKPAQAATTVSPDELAFGEEGNVSGERFVDRIAADQDLEQQFLDDESRLALHSALQQLSPRDRRLIQRRFFEETPLAELADEEEFAKPGMSRERLRQEVDGDIAYLAWKAEAADNRYELGTDTFIVRDGKIVTQTFTGKISLKE